MNRTIRIFIISAILTTVTSCQNNNNAADDEEFQTSDYSITYKKSGFKKVPNGSVYAIEYCASGLLRNNTADIVKGAFLEMRVVIKLDNGNEITNEQIDPSPFMFDSYHELLKGQFLPNSEKEFDLNSLRLDQEYRSYPIRRFYIQYVIKGDNALEGDKPINELVEQREVTNEWKRFAKDF